MKRMLCTIACMIIAIPAARAADEIRQKTCPVSGKPISADKSVEHEGQKVYFCCGGCAKTFEKSPMKYLPAVYREVYPQQVQVKCPYSGKPVKADAKADLKGTTVYFCCNHCIEKAEGDPESALSKLKDASTTQVHCPMSGKAIKPSISAEKDGKTVYFCCQGCAKHFKEDDKEAAAILTPEVGVVARGATAKNDLVLCAACASGGKTEPIYRSKAKTVTHEGKRYFVAGDGCADSFRSDAAKCIAAVDKAMKELEGKSK